MVLMNWQNKREFQTHTLQRGGPESSACESPCSITSGLLSHGETDKKHIKRYILLFCKDKTDTFNPLE